MNFDANISAAETTSAETANLLNLGFEGLEPFIGKSKELRQTLVRLGKIGDKATNRAARNAARELQKRGIDPLAFFLPRIRSDERVFEEKEILDFYVAHLHYPTFNVADSAVTIGVAIFIAHIVFKKMPF